MGPTTCVECGADSRNDELAVLCRRCGALLDVPGFASADDSPSALPATLDRDAAAEALRDWAGSRWFAPAALKLVEGPEHARLAHVPHWIVDLDAVTEYRGERGEYYHVTETTRNSDGTTSSRRVRKTRWHRAEGVVASSYTDLLVVATEAECRARVEMLAPWPLDGLRATDAPGQVLFRAVDADGAFDAARSLVLQRIRRACVADIGGDDQRLGKVETTYPHVERRAVLLPVWTAGYRHGGKAWHVLINAATGQVVGQRPYSAWKIALLVGAMLAVIAVLAGAVALSR